MDELRAIGGEDWFNLGDKDIALHLLRAQLRSEGLSATDVARVLRARFRVACSITPAADQPVRTMVHTPDGVLTFQHYFVRHRTEPAISKITYEGAGGALFSPMILAALGDPALEAIVIAPSNPFLSIDPILAISDARAALRRSRAPIIAVTPVIAGAAVKGPTAKIMEEVGMPVTAAAVAAHYGDLIDGFVLDQLDAAERADIESRGVTCTLAPTLMRDDADKIALAEHVLAFAKRCPRRRNAA